MQCLRPLSHNEQKAISLTSTINEEQKPTLSTSTMDTKEAPTSRLLDPTAFNALWKEASNTATIPPESLGQLRNWTDPLIYGHQTSQYPANWNIPDLTEHVVREDGIPFAQGRLANYWKGVWRSGSQRYKACYWYYRVHYRT